MNTRYRLYYNVLRIPLIFLLTSCYTPDVRIDANYDSLKENRMEMYSLKQELEASTKETPDWVSSYLDSWDCGDNFCTIGRAEISADDATAFTCLDVSRLKAKANLVSTIQTDISNKIILGAEGLKIHQQELKQILVEGFEARNLSNIRIGENYYQKILKHSNESPQAFYQCFSVAKISKFNLQNLITREANKVLGVGASKEFKKQIDQEWNRFFKLSVAPENSKVRFDDLEARASIASELVDGDLGSIRDNVLRVAKAFTSLPYQLGGDLADGSLDCSNYVRTVYSAFGLKLPRTSPEQFVDARGEAVSEDLLPGDLLFFKGSLRPSDQPSHVGIYLGEGKFINANGNANARQVQIDDFSSSYWQEKYLGGRRFINQANFDSSLLSQNH